MIGKTVKNLLGYEHIIDWSSSWLENRLQD